jgi:acetyltransferase-like isoleucine patch superfamily enzyme
VFAIEPGVGDSDPARIEIGEAAFVEDGVELGLIPGARLVVGRNSSLHRGCVVLGNVRIGANCVFSYNIYVATGTHVVRERPTWLIKDQDEANADARLSEIVWIDDDVWIGWGAFVRSGVHVGRGAVIGANAVVTTDVEPYAIYAGVPARKVGERLSFAPPAAIDARDDACLPYFYSGFLDDQAALKASRATGGIALAGPARIVLAAAAGGGVRLRGEVAGDPGVRLQVCFGGGEATEQTLGAGPFDFTIGARPARADTLPAQLRAHTVIDLNAGADARRVTIRAAELAA